MNKEAQNQKITIGVVGLGLMGSSIVTSLLISGHPVVAVAPIPGEEQSAKTNIHRLLEVCLTDHLISSPIDQYWSNLTITSNYMDLNHCKLVVECVIERSDIKKKVYTKIANIVDKEAVIATNTSAIAISDLQLFVPHPERFIGIHWAEPAFATRFLEIVMGNCTSPLVADWVYTLAGEWGKEPTLLRKDIKGFITNRLMYASYRESLSLIENKQTNIEDLDKAFQYGIGSWITLMGLFRRMDYLGIEDFKQILENIFPLLNNSDEVSPLMEKIKNARGIKDGIGFYKYNKEEEQKWSTAFENFNKDILELSERYRKKKLELLERKEQFIKEER